MKADSLAILFVRFAAVGLAVCGAIQMIGPWAQTKIAMAAMDPQSREMLGEMTMMPFSSSAVLENAVRANAILGGIFLVLAILLLAGSSAIGRMLARGLD